MSMRALTTGALSAVVLCVGAFGCGDGGGSGGNGGSGGSGGIDTEACLECEEEYGDDLNLCSEIYGACLSAASEFGDIGDCDRDLGFCGADVSEVASDCYDACGDSLTSISLLCAGTCILEYGICNGEASDDVELCLLDCEDTFCEDVCFAEYDVDALACEQQLDSCTDEC